MKLVEQFRRSESALPIVTTYCPNYNPKEPGELLGSPTKMMLDSFAPDGIPLFRAASVDEECQKARRPQRARFISAHFLITVGRFVEDVPYDPRLYCHGEEITLAVRAYTRGYEFFHPSEVIMWHQYSRHGRPRHWDDHSDESGIDIPWWQQRDAASRALVTGFLRNPTIGPLRVRTKPHLCGI